jgi:hypothetical protein
MMMGNDVVSAYRSCNVLSRYTQPATQVCRFVPRHRLIPHTHTSPNTHHFPSPPPTTTRARPTADRFISNSTLNLFSLSRQVPEESGALCINDKREAWCFASEIGGVKGDRIWPVRSASHVGTLVLTAGLNLIEYR